MVDRRQVVQIKAEGSGGTGFLVAAGKLATALHVVVHLDEDERVITDDDGHPIPLDGLEFLHYVEGHGWERGALDFDPARDKQWSILDDWVILDVHSGVRSPSWPCRRLEHTNDLQYAESFGFPAKFVDQGTPLDGPIASVNEPVPLGPTSMIHVHRARFKQCEGETGISLQGCSGGPVVVGDHVIGLIRHFVRASDDPASVMHNRPAADACFITPIERLPVELALSRRDELVCADELESYLTRLEAEHEHIKLLGFNTTYRVRLELAELYVELEAVIDRRLSGHQIRTSQDLADDEPAQDSRARERTSFDRVFFRARLQRFRGIVILGDPGSGKTTHLKQVLLTVIRTGPQALGLPPDMVPVYLSLQGLRANQDSLPSLIAEQFREPSEKLDADLGRRLCARGRLLLLLDGLDEVADTDDRRRVKQWIERARDNMPDCVFVVTSRYAGYRPVPFDEHFLEVHIRPFDDEQMSAFVRNWYSIVGAELNRIPEEAERVAKAHADELLATLTSSAFASASRLYGMSHNPLMLTTICLVHHDKGGLPQARAALYDDAIKVLLERWQRFRRSEKAPLTAEQALEVLEPVAWWMHGEDGRRFASSGELLPVVTDAMRKIGHNASMAANFLEVVRDESGVLTGFGVDEYGFAHLGLQEYLAAQQLRLAGHHDKRVFDELATKFDQPWWQEVILLMLGQHKPRVFEPFMRAVLRHPSFVEWSSSQMMGLCWADAASPTADALLEVLRESDGRGLVRRWLRIGDARARSLAERQLAAVKLLAQVMPAELERHHDVLRNHASAKVRDWMNLQRGAVIVDETSGIELVRLPGGTFSMGTAEADGEGYDDERPQHEVTLAEFLMAKTPVTNEQYGRYLAANPNAPKPEYWGDRNYNQPQQPVVGVSWDEAQAYCDWAGLVLPTEAQWEYAARGGQPTRYWSGDDEADLKRVGWYAGNSDMRLHPVGELPANDFGLHDVHGNVWEWTRDASGSYETKPQPGDGLRHEPVGDASRVIRGGSFDDDARFARAAYRFYWHPANRYRFVGFRPARVIP